MFKVCIDPGHGGSDRSNRGPNGYVEADGVLAISKYLKEELESTGQFHVILTRDTDKTISLTERAKIAVDNKVDLFISEHTNAGPVSAGGTVVYYSVDIPEDKSLASKLSSAVANALGINDRGAKTRESEKYPGEDYYTVIDKTQDGGVPHVFLIESAFHSNPQEEKLLLQEENLKKIAQAQSKAICDFFNMKGDAIMILKKGDKGEYVKKLQENLNKLGYSCGIADGIFGAKTEQAVKAFQNANKLAVDGVAGPQTQGKIEELLKAHEVNYKALYEETKLQYNQKVLELNLAKSEIQELKNRLNQIYQISRI